MAKTARKPLTGEQRRKFFSMCGAAARNLGLSGREAVEEYRHRVMREEAGCASMAELGRTGDFDACVRRFAADAGDYLGAIDAELMETKRLAFVVKVMCCQVMQLKGGDERGARNYLEGILAQARVPCGTYAADETFWMDVAPSTLRRLLQILDTHRRRLLRAAFPDAPMAFDATVRYEVGGAVATRVTGLPPSYYAALPFHVNVRGEKEVEG